MRLRRGRPCDRAAAAREKLFGEYSFGTLQNYGWVARSVETSLRNEVLSFDHHRFVAPLPPAEQRK
jgi:hypothetical protein